MTTYAAWKEHYKAKRTNERLGQAFVNDFIKGVWTDLYYTNDESKAQRLILEHLQDTQYWPNVPPAIDREYQRVREEFIYGN